MPNEPALLDTNVLVYSLYHDAPQHAACRVLVEKARSADAALFVAARTMAEFYSVVTNPRRATNPRSAAEAVDTIERCLAMPGLALVDQPTDELARPGATYYATMPLSVAIFSIFNSSPQ